MGTLYQDVRFALRTLWANRGFTVIAIAALALGVGANSAIFSVVNAVVLRPLPYRDPQRLVALWIGLNQKGFDELEVSAPEFTDFRTRSSSFEKVAAYSAGGFNMTGAGEPERIQGLSATADLFPALGVAPLKGRAFNEQEDKPGSDGVVVISHSLWQRRFGGDAEVVGNTLTLDGQTCTVVGVMPASFHFPDNDTDIWKPIAFDADLLGPNNRGSHFLSVVGRLKDGVAFEQAQAEVATLARNVGGENATMYPRGLTALLRPLQDEVVGDSVRRSLYVMLGAVGLVLLIACANVANLLLARAASRRKEVAVRTALGASRARIVRQLLTESVLLSLAGGVLGLVLALWGVDLLVAAIPAAQLAQMPYLRNLSLNPDVLLFALGLSLATGILFGLTPALAASRADLQEAMKEGGRASVSRGPRRLRDLLVVSEVALALVLLVGAGLLMKSLTAMLKVDPGFDARNVLTMRVALPPARYADDASSARFHAELLRRVAAVPGVRGAAETSNLPLAAEGGTGTPIVVGRSQPEGETGESHLRTVSANYFEVMGLPVVAGRAFNERDRVDAPGVLLVNKTFAERIFPGEDPVGRRVSFKWSADRPPFEIVGVVGDEKVTSLDARTTPVIYFDEQQSPDSATALVVRAANGVDADALSRAVRGEVRALDPEVPVFAVQTLEQMVAGSRATFMRRYPAYLTGLFACVALLLALVGIYGVISYTVTQRTHEIAVRVALGARTRDVLRLVVGHGLGLALAGVCFGTVGALALTRLISNLLFGVSAADPAVYGLVSALLFAVALLACLAPARRATKVDPMEALRYE
jgi:putative ABC transport system permease protein